MRRYQDWPMRLDRALREMAERSFAYGDHDCALAAADLLLAYTDTDIAAEWRNGYDSKKGALRILADHEGIEGLAEYIAATHRLEEVPPAFAQRGDGVLIDTAEGLAFGIVDLTGRHAVVAYGTGWRQMPGPFARAWRIP